MAQMGTADVTYTKLEYANRGCPSDPTAGYGFTLLFPNGSNVLYTSGGIPLSAGKLGVPAGIKELFLEDDGSSVGYVAKWDQLANTIRLYQSAGFGTGSAVAAAALVEVGTAATVSSTTLRVFVSGW